MIIEFLQLIDFLKNGTVRLLFPFFLTHVLFLLLARHYSRKYRCFGHNPFQKYRTSVIISTWRENPKWLTKAVKTALNAGADEVILAYSKDDPSACQVAKKFNDKISTIVFEKRVPKKVAVYEGCKRARGDIICVQDSDTFIEKSALTELSKAFDSDPKIGGVVAYNIIFNKKHFAGKLSCIVERSRNFINKAFSVFGQVHVLDSRFCAYRKEAIAPLMDEYLNNRFLGKDVVIGEDKMLTYLLQKTGWKCVMQSSAVDYTAAPTSLTGFLKQQLRWARSGYMYLFRHKLCLKLHWLLTFHILLYFLSPIVFPIIIIYDVFFTPSLLPMSLAMSLALVTFGIALITCCRGKIADLEIKWRDTPVIGIFSILVMVPLMLYALATLWKQDSWVSR